MGLDPAAALLVAGRGGRVPAWQGRSEVVSGGGGDGGGGRGAGGVFNVFSQDMVLQRFVEQFSGDFSAPVQGSTARFVEQNHVAWVWWCRSPT